MVGQHPQESTTKGCKFRGDNTFQHDVDIVIEIPEKGRAIQFGRYNQGGEMEILLRLPKSAYTFFNITLNLMIKRDELIAMRAIALCFKPFLKPEEAYIYTNLGHTQFAKRCEEFGVYKNNSGYYKREDIDKMLSGEKAPFTEVTKKLKL